MGFFSDILKGGAGSLVEQIGSVADQFHLSGEEKQELNLRMQELVLKREQMLEESATAEMTAKERVLVAELNQGDPFTKRARPTVVYAGLAFILLNYTVVPGIALMGGNAPESCVESAANGQTVVTCKAQYLELPEEFWWAWAGIVSTWSIGRSAEKMGVNNKVVRGITGSRRPTRDDAVG